MFFFNCSSFLCVRSGVLGCSNIGCLRWGFSYTFPICGYASYFRTLEIHNAMYKGTVNYNSLITLVMVLCFLFLFILQVS